MSKTRLYQVKSETTGAVRLIEASTPRGAVAHAARKEFTASIPAQHEVFALAKAGVEIEVAGDEPVSIETRAAVA
jgi:hypothetical protein